jgi:hypothetical protein
VREGEQGGFGGIAKSAPAGFLVVGGDQLRVVAERGRFEQYAEALWERASECLALPLEGSLRGVSRAADGDALVVRQPERLHRHLVLGEGAGFIRADDVGGAQGLHGGQTPDDGAPPGHALHADGQGDGHRHREPLGHQRHHLAEGHHKNVRPGHSPEKPEPHHRRKQHDRREDQQTAQFCEAHFHGRSRLPGRGGEPRDFAHLSLHARAGDQRLAPARRDLGAREHHVSAVRKQRFPGERLGVFWNGQRFAGERGLGALKGGRFNEPRVGPDRISRGEQHDVARHQPAGFKILCEPVTADPDLDP